MRDVYFLGNRSIKPISTPKGEAVAQLEFPLDKLITIDFNLDVLSQEQRSVYIDYMKYINYDKLEFDQVWCGKNNGYLLDQKGELWVFGKNNKGQLGIIMKKDYIQRIPLNFNRMYIGQSNKYRSISVGTDHMMVIDQLDKLYGWGSNSCKQVLVAGGDMKQAVEESQQDNQKSIEMWNSKSIDIWNSNSSIHPPIRPETQTSQPKIESESCFSIPVLIKEYKSLQKIICGYNCTFVIMNSRLYVQGQDKMGRLGKGPHITMIEYPLELMFNSIRTNKIKIQGVSSGYRHSLAWSVAGELYSWGEGSYGKLGHQMLNNNYNYIIHYPQKVDMFKDRKIVQGGCGYEHSLIIDVRGQLIQFGQILSKNKRTPEKMTYHDGCSFFSYSSPTSTTSTSTTIQTEKINRYQLLNKDNQTFIKASTFGGQNMALDNHDSLYVWGINQHDSLGITNRTLIDHPTKLNDFKGIVNFACGAGFALVIASSNVYNEDQGKAFKVGRSHDSFKQDCFNIVKSKIEHFKDIVNHKSTILESIELDHFSKYSKEQQKKLKKEGLTNQQQTTSKRKGMNNYNASILGFTKQESIVSIGNSQTKPFHGSTIMVKTGSLMNKRANADIDKYFKDSKKKHMLKRDKYSSSLDMDNLQNILQKMTQKRQENQQYIIERELILKDKQQKNYNRMSQVISSRGLLMHQNAQNKLISLDEKMMYSKMRSSSKRIITKVLTIFSVIVNLKELQKLTKMAVKMKKRNFCLTVWIGKIQKAYRIHVLNRLLVTENIYLDSFRIQLGVVLRIRRVRKWIQQFARLQKILIVKKIHDRLYSNLLIIRNKTKMIQRQVKIRLSDKKVQVRFMVGLFDSFLLKMVEVQKQNNNLTAIQDKTFEHLSKYQQHIREPSYIFSKYTGQQKENDIGDQVMGQAGLQTILDNYNYGQVNQATTGVASKKFMGKLKKLGGMQIFVDKAKDKNNEDGPKLNRLKTKVQKRTVINKLIQKNSTNTPIIQTENIHPTVLKQQKHQHLLNNHSLYFDKSGILIYSQDRQYFQMIPHHQIKFENKKVLEKLMDQITVAEKQVKQETMVSIILNFRLVFYNEKKAYLKAMDKFIHDNRKSIDIVRAKMMLKLKGDELKKINYQEQLQINFQRNKNLICEKDHLPFEKLIYKIGKRLKNSPQEPQFSISLTYQQFRHYFEQIYLQQLKQKCYQIIENYHNNINNNNKETNKSNVNVPNQQIQNQ